MDYREAFWYVSIISASDGDGDSILYSITTANFDLDADGNNPFVGFFELGHSLLTILMTCSRTPGTTSGYQIISDRMERECPLR